MRLTALAWLKKQYHKALEDLIHANARHCTVEEHDSLQHKAAMLEWLMVEIKEGGNGER